MNNEKLKQTFSIITPLGLEELAISELAERGIDTSLLKKEKGAIILNLAAVDFYPHIPFLKVPTKVLLEIDSFTCRDIVKFYNKLIKIRWNNFLHGQIPKFNISAKNSRLFDSRKMDESATKALQEYYKAQPASKKFSKKLEQLPPCAIHIRLLDDQCKVSLDISGERLDKRSLKIFTSEAPMRENLASACLLFCLKEAKKKNRKISTLVDPMCGSGTFLFEALMMNQPQARDFYYKYLPNYKLEKKYRYEKPFYFTELLGNEINDNTFNGLLKNKENFQKLFSSELPIKLTHSDAKDYEAKGRQEILLLTNPPYGKRVLIAGDKRDYFTQLLESFSTNIAPDYIAFVIPKIIANPRHQNYKVLNTLNFSNGGIDVKLVLWERK